MPGISINLSIHLPVYSVETFAIDSIGQTESLLQVAWLRMYCTYLVTARQVESTLCRCPKIWVRISLGIDSSLASDFSLPRNQQGLKAPDVGYNLRLGGFGAWRCQSEIVYLWRESGLILWTANGSVLHLLILSRNFQQNTEEGRVTYPAAAEVVMDPIPPCLATEVTILLVSGL